jgi:hypothetical protein
LKPPIGAAMPPTTEPAQPEQGLPEGENPPDKGLPAAGPAGAPPREEGYPTPPSEQPPKPNPTE